MIKYMFAEPLDKHQFLG